jgi:hypothetical protein
MVEERKISDVIIEVFEVVSEIRDRTRNYENNSKIALSKINRIESLLLEKNKIVNPISKPSVEIDTFDFVEVADTRTALAKALDAEEDRDSLNEAKLEDGGIKRGARKLDVGKKCTVQQKIVYSDNKNVYMAQVEIFQDGKSIKQLRSNQTGKWIALLLPGKYEIKVDKAATSNKPKIDAKYSIIVDAADVLELPVQKV